jgi:ferredoxin, 2Fe-2S
MRRATSANYAAFCASPPRGKLLIRVSERCEDPRMPSIVVVDRDGQEHTVEAKSGLKLMETLRELDYGIAAICGGMCSCATCHVYVDDAWLTRLPAAMSDERELLSELSHYRNTSRLSCQVEMTDALAGIKVKIAPDE